MKFLLILFFIIGPAWAQEVQVVDVPWAELDEQKHVKLIEPLPPDIKKIIGRIILGDGRVCNGCTVLVQRGVPIVVIDRDNFQWLIKGGTSIYIDKHPYLKFFGRVMAASAQGYAKGMQEAAQAQLQNIPRQTNCSTNPVGYGHYTTRCTSY